jgi:basic membrane protein A and related proteins
MKKIIALVMSMVIILSFGVVGNASTSSMPAKKNVKVGFIYVGPIGDGGYTQAHNDGRLYLQKTLGVKTVYIENVAEDTVAVGKAVDNMVAQGVNVIFGTSFGFMDGMVKAAKKYPNVVFMHCSGYKTSANLGVYFGRMEQPRYLSGIAAGLKTQTNVIGYVAAFPIPECIREINAFTLGAQSVNPKVTVRVTWTHTWYDPAKEKEAAKALLDQNADVIAQHQDTAGPMQAAEERGKFAIGFDLDARAKAPKAYITAPVWDWGPYYVKAVKSVMDGTWKTGNYWGGMQDGIVKLAPLTANAKPGTAEAIAKAQKFILSAPNMEFSGPIYDQTGKLRVAKGKTLSDADQLSMAWFVKGVIGEPK